MSDVAPESNGYPSFDAFFTRPLRPGARPIDGAAIVSPADGRLVDCGPIDERCHLTVKGQPYTVLDLLENDADARRYSGGSFCVIYLSPRDYHRVHCPIEGSLTAVRGIPGDLYPVNSIGERHVPRLFARNQRVVFLLDGAAVGRVALVMVGAIIVGRITVTALDELDIVGDRRIFPPKTMMRGDEIGIFHLGSTVVMLAEPGEVLSRSPGPVRYGQSLFAGES
jgi:phosphatidylserine decarboxylase